jgi:hypothetical protein
VDEGSLETTDHDTLSPVIPAQAGIHCAVALFLKGNNKIKMDSGFRRNDDDNTQGFPLLTGMRLPWATRE